MIEPVAPAGSLDPQLDEDWLNQKIKLLTDRIEEKHAQADEARKQSQIADSERKSLALERDNAANRYQRMQDRFSQAEALSAIDTNEGANLRVLQTPTLERDKVGPKRLSLLLKGLLAGLFVGSLFAILRQTLDPTLRYPELFEQSHGLPVLGVVPQSSALRKLPRSPAQDPGRA
jgi:uncharacterized protein involved in exopolysaccharide biosynthesis